MDDDGRTETRERAARAAAARAQARSLSRAGNHDAAIKLLRAASESDCRDDVGIRMDLVTALLAAGRIEEAEAVRLPGGMATP